MCAQLVQHPVGEKKKKKTDENKAGVGRRDTVTSVSMRKKTEFQNTEH